MKVLVVEDDPNVAQSIQQLLSLCHYAVDVVADAETALPMADAFAYDLAIVDIGLPGIDGLALCAQLRQAGQQLPVLLLTGQEHIGAQKAAALNSGADDYVSKPFETEELQARVQALLRRGGTAAPPVLTWGALSIDPSRRRVTYGTTLLSPTPKEYAILELLLRQAQTTFSAADILNRVWDSAEAPGEEVIRYHIKELRQKLTAAGAPKDWIQTLHGVGYRLNPLYSERLAQQVAQAASLPEVAELTVVNEQLRLALEEVQMQGEELREQNEELRDTRLALEREHQRYRDLFENAPDGYLITDAHGLIQAANQMATTMLAMTAEQLQGGPLLHFIHPGDRRSFRYHLPRGDWPANWEIHLQPHRRAAFPVLISVIPILDDQQQVTEFRWLLRDIRDRKQLEQRLRDSHADLERRITERTAELREREAFLRGIYDGAAQAIFVVDVTPAGDFRYADFNQQALTMSGMSLADVQHQSPEVAFGEVVGAEFRQHYQDCVAAGHSLAYEEHFELHDRTLWTITTLAPIRDHTGRIARLVGTVVDISDRKQLELSLRDSEAKLSRIFNNAVAAISEFYAYPDRTYRHTFMSAGCAAVYGYSQQAMLTDKRLWASRVLPEDMDSVVMKAFERIFAEDIFTIEYCFLDPDDQVRWVAETLISHHDEARDLWLVTTVAVNISDRKQAEIALHKQIRQEYLLADIAQDIRRSLQVREVLALTVQRVRTWLETDRVIIFRFRADWQGDVIEESVGPTWTPIRSTTIYDPCFEERYIAPYRQGYISTLNDVEQAQIEPCYLELLRSFQVRANLAVPILQGETLWGLLIAHHCSGPRQWKPGEIALLRRLAVQVGIAIQQSELYERTRQELAARRQMQTVLEASEERFRTLSAAAPVGILQSNADGICLYANQCWQTLSGLSAQDSLGLGWQTAIHPSDRPQVQRGWADFLHHHEECQSEFRLLTASGETRWVSARAAVIQSATAENIGNVCIITDITPQKQAAQKIEEQAALLDIAPDAIFTCDLDDQILYWNKGAENLYGWTAAEAQGQVAHQLLQEHPDQVAAILQILFDQGEWRGEMAKVTKTGESGVVESCWTLVRDADGHPQYVLTVNTDITNQKQLEAQFYQAQKLESLGQLASSIAHDLNNVFTPILTVSQVFQIKHRDLDDKSQQLLKILENSARRGAGMVKQILSVARCEPGQRQLLPPLEILREVAALAQESFPKNITLQRDFAGLAPPAAADCLISVDPTQLHQVLMNLMINARDAMPEGGQLTLSAAITWVDEAIAQATLDAQVGDYVVIAVTDTGKGIEAAIRDRIFDPFFTTKEPGKGTGLGLSTVLSLVREANGFLQVMSQVNRGTTVNVYLPVVTAIAPEQPAPLPPATPVPPRLPPSLGNQVLVVDDDATVQQATQSLLDNHHYATLTATDGATAIALYRQHQDHIRLVILDITMPEMSGIELIEHLRALNPAVRIIAISGLPANQTPALQAGANIFLMKPYTLDALLAGVENLMH